MHSKTAMDGKEKGCKQNSVDDIYFDLVGTKRKQYIIYLIVREKLDIFLILIAKVFMYSVLKTICLGF